MADELNDFSALLDRVLQGDEQAYRQFFDQHQGILIQLIRRRLPRSSPLRREIDSTDVAQEVWQRVFAHPEKLRDFATFNDFLRLLTKVANHRVDHARRKYLDTQKRDLRRDRSLSDPDIASAAAQQADPQPDPIARLVFNETLVRWFRSLSRRQQSIVIMRRNGSTYPEIAEQMDCSVRSIEREVAELRTNLTPQMCR